MRKETVLLNEELFSCEKNEKAPLTNCLRAYAYIKLNIHTTK